MDVIKGGHYNSLLLHRTTMLSYSKHIYVCYFNEIYQLTMKGISKSTPVLSPISPRGNNNKKKLESDN